MPRRHSCFACHVLLPREALHFQWIPAGYRGRPSSAKVLMCAECANKQGEENKVQNEKLIFGLIAFLVICALIGLFGMMVR
jgi:hypothetical protein